MEDIRKATKEDKILQEVIRLTRFNRWYEIEKIIPKGFTKDEFCLLKQFRKIKDELTILPDNDVILKNNRIILPDIYQSIAVKLKLAHAGHLGIQKTKSLLRSKVFFFGLDITVENEIRKCIACQSIVKPRSPAPLQIIPIPEQAWQKLNMDFIGPFPNGEYIFATIDQRSKFPEIDFMISTSANNVINSLDRMISIIYGIPEEIVSDNGPPFKSFAFKEYMESKGIHHRRITPVWPQANAYAEKFMSSLKKIATAAFIEKKEWKRETYKFLFSYRNSPHSTTKVPPMMFQRKLRHLIPAISPDIDLNLHKEVDNNDQYAKEKAKAYTDNRFKSEWKDLKTDDLVLVKQRKMNKLTPIFEPHPYRVTEKKGTMVTAQSDITGKSITRNVSHFKRVPEKTEFPMIEEEEDDKEGADESGETNQQ